MEIHRWVRFFEMGDAGPIDERETGFIPIVKGMHVFIDGLGYTVKDVGFQIAIANWYQDIFLVPENSFQLE